MLAALGCTRLTRTCRWQNRETAAHHRPLLLKRAILPSKLQWHAGRACQRQQLLHAAGWQAHTQVQDFWAAEQATPCMAGAAAAAVRHVCRACGMLTEAEPALPVSAGSAKTQADMVTLRWRLQPLCESFMPPMAALQIIFSWQSPAQACRMCTHWAASSGVGAACCGCWVGW